MKRENSQLSFSQFLAVLMLGGPPVTVVAFNIGPGRWVNSLQGELLGWYSTSISILAVLSMEFALFYIIAITVRWITGRTIVELFSKKMRDD